MTTVHTHKPHGHKKKRKAVRRPQALICRLTLHRGVMTIFPSQDIEISLKLGNRRYPRLRFKQAAEFVRTAVRYDRETYQHFVLVINEDHWITGFWSDVLNPSDPPGEWDWIGTDRLLHRAESALYRDDYREALRYFYYAVDAYNQAHSKLNDYLDGVRIGAERAITLIEITETALVGALGASAPAWSLIQKAGFAAAFKAEEQLLAQGFSGEFKWNKAGQDILFEFASSLLGGALADSFKKLLAPKLVKWMTSGPSEGWLEKAVADLASKGILPNAVKGWRGKLIDHIAQLALMVLGAAVVRVAHESDEKGVKDFIADLLDDLGNEEQQIIGKALRLF